MKLLSIEPCALPENALLNKYVRQEAYTDCYRTQVAGHISHAQFVTAFYTTALFKLERIILKLILSKPSTDDQVTQLANGETDWFAAWFVEDRGENQLLLTDYRHLTRSWLMVEHSDSGSQQMTRLYFGSAVIPRQRSKEGKLSFGRGFSVLIGFHKIYSVLLLFSAKVRLKRGGR